MRRREEAHRIAANVIKPIEGFVVEYRPDRREGDERPNKV